MKKIIIAITSAFMLFATSAMSMDLRPTIGISGNVAAYSALGVEDNYNEAGTAIDETAKVSGAFATEYASIFVEASVNDVLSIGLDYVPQDFETPQNVSNEDQSNEKHVSARFEDLTTLYAKINVPLGGAYVKVGYSEVDVLPRTSGGSGNTYKNTSTSGMTVGLGYNHEVDNGVSVRLEVSASEFDDVTTHNGQTNKTEITVKDIWGARGTVSIVKSF